jgi:hypothetical protein
VVVILLAEVPALAVITASVPNTTLPPVASPVPEMPMALVWLEKAVELAGEPLSPTLVLVAVMSASSEAVRVPAPPTVTPVSLKP